MNFIVPKNWASFQHYKDRAPAWIKLHGDLLDDFEFHCLPLASKALAPMLWLLASKYDGGKIPLDYPKLAFRLRLSSDEVESAVKSLISAGFFVVSGDVEQDDSKPLAECLPRERGEKEEEGEADAPAAPTKAPRTKPKTALPENFTVSERVKTWATREGFSEGRVAANFSKFVLSARSKDYRYADWDAALMTAIRDDWAKVGDAAPANSESASPYRRFQP